MANEHGACITPQKASAFLRSTLWLCSSGQQQQKQQYWLNAITTTQTAGERAVALTDGKSMSWEAIVKDGKFHHFHTSTPL